MSDIAAAPDTAVAQNTDDRKTATLAGWTPQPGFHRDADGLIHVHDYALARTMLRAPESQQAGFGADIVLNTKSLMRPPVIFLEGQAHQDLRRATARFFAPRAVEENYLALMTREADRMIDDLLRKKRGRLEVMAMDMATAVAAEIAGLTEHLWPGMAQRIAGFLKDPPLDQKMTPLVLWKIIASQFRLLKFLIVDVKPNIRLRRKAPRADVISHLLSLGYKDAEILTECVIFGAAGMVTTREFIVVATLHLLGKPDLKARFLAAGDEEQRAILEEILRLEPVIGRLTRKTTAPVDLPDGHRVEAGERVAVDIRSVNTDSAAVGGCPFHLDPDRHIDQKIGAPVMGFGDGRHRCPGAYIAMQESAIFLKRLLALPRLRVVGEPVVAYNSLIHGYEYHECVIALD